jgi:hypothetical protein
MLDDMVIVSEAGVILVAVTDAPEVMAIVTDAANF